MNPAALKALAEGNVDNFLTASTPGGIEAQEAAGQQGMVKSEALPKDMRPGVREKLEELGVTFGKDVDDIFIEAKLPPGWGKRATSHSMWSDLMNAEGQIVAHIFYKAAFYDRSAHMNLAEGFDNE